MRNRVAVENELDASGALLVSKRNSPVMQFLALFLGRQFMLGFWTTLRLPFQRRCRIYYPEGVTIPRWHWQVIDHELVHVEQFKPWWGPWAMILGAVLLPLPVLFSGRWFIERRAYLRDIKDGRRTVNGVVELLWSGYGWAWPKPLMRRWFQRMTAC